MNLKKSDKIIAVLGVVVLVVAAIAIIYYMGEEEPTEIMKEDDGLSEFIVDVSTYDSEIKSKESHVIKDKLIGNSPVSIDVEIPVDYLREAEIIVKYTDAQSIKFLKKLTEDTLTVVVKDDEGNKIESGSIVGSGNVTVVIPGKDCIDFGVIRADDLSEANKRKDENITLTGESDIYTVTVTIKHKGFLERLRKDQFSIEVLGEYYQYKVVESETNNEDNNDDDTEMSQDDSVYTAQSYYRYLSNTGFH